MSWHNFNEGSQVACKVFYQQHFIVKRVWHVSCRFVRVVVQKQDLHLQLWLNLQI